MSAIAGIVLAGGGSRRMGTDKTRLVFDGKPLLERSLEAMRPYCAEQSGGAGMFVVFGEHERPVPDGVRALRDEVLGQGPLRGLATGLSAASASGAAAAVVLSADLPLITAAVVGELLAAFEAGRAEALLAADHERTHPLVAVCSTALAAPAVAALAAGKRAMMEFLNSRAIRKTQVSEPLALSNVNTPQEWAALSRLRSEP
ncbi:MAG: molybdenum cofactor guanylyltransferase [Segniliparus sp.]|uniref:molybdenum cofactor guanylyltransferase n=1 Tax=Segniliparus sp. TaxID=2804064 RepID=UPI003F32BA25